MGSGASRPQYAFFSNIDLLKVLNSAGAGEGRIWQKKFNLETPKIKTVKFPQKVASDEIPSVSKYRRHTSALRVVDIRLAGIAANGETEIE